MRARPSRGTPPQPPSAIETGTWAIGDADRLRAFPTRGAGRKAMGQFVEDPLDRPHRSRMARARGVGRAIKQTTPAGDRSCDGEGVDSARNLGSVTTLLPRLPGCHQRQPVVSQPLSGPTLRQDWSEFPVSTAAAALGEGWRPTRSQRKSSSPIRASSTGGAAYYAYRRGSSQPRINTFHRKFSG